MSIPLRGAVASATIALAVTVGAVPAQASHREPHEAPEESSQSPRRAPLPRTMRGLESSYARRQLEMSLDLSLAQMAIRRERATLVSDWQGRARKAVRYAYQQRGKPYVWGGTGRRGFDCSGLVQRSWRHAGVAIPRVAADQYRRIHTHVAEKRLQPGDLVYFNHLSHVGLYVGSGRFIHSPHTGSYVQVARLDDYWREHYVGAARPDWPRLPEIPREVSQLEDRTGWS
jgi:peptidoglycan DL-endopeptidase CwlO